MSVTALKESKSQRVKDTTTERPPRTSSSEALRAPAKLRPDQKALIEQVCFIWAEHQGWSVVRWPKNRRYDAILITEWARRLGGSIDRWRAAIARVPHDAAFTALTTPPQPGRTCLLEDVLMDSRGREAAWAEEKHHHADDSRAVADVLRSMLGIDPSAIGQRMDPVLRTEAQEEAAREHRAARAAGRA
jgi:hypothetical protein